MAKEIPYFKFFVGEWANGDITAENYKTQGVFINICSLYWTKEGKLSEVFVKKKLKANKEISTLIESDIIKVENGNIIINFLDEQLLECEGVRKRNSAAGIASAAKRALNKNSTPVEHPLNDLSTETQPLREDKEKRREEKIKKPLSNFSSWRDIIKNDEVEIRNLFQLLLGKFTFLDLQALHRDLPQRLNNYEVYNKQFNILLEDEKHLKNSFRKFALAHWNKNTDQVIRLKK
jgi:hypothetical protein